MPVLRAVFVVLCVGVWLPAIAVRAAEDSGGTLLSNGVTAHRGNSAEQPENTLAAVRSALEVGADWIEVDVFRTRDGQLVVIHDRTTERVGDKTLVVPESTYAELLAVDVAADFRKRHNLSLEECPPARIPLLADVIELIKPQRRTRLSIQPKMDCVADAVKLIEQLEAAERVGFNDGNRQFLAEVKRLAPGIPVFWDRGRSNLDDDLRIARELGFEALVLHEPAVTAESIRKIKQAGLEAGVWTVNEPAAMRRLLKLGVDRLYTDHPRELLDLYAAGRFQPVTCGGHYAMHLQGVCTNRRDAIYWSFTTVLVKTDLKGRVIRQIEVANHHGDLCYQARQVHVAVNLGRFNRPAGMADSWIYSYDADSLEEIARHKTPQVVHGAGGIASRGDRFMVVGGLPPETEENYLYEFDRSFKFLKRHRLDSGYTLMGIQTAAFGEGRFWLGCYGSPPTLLIVDESSRLRSQHNFHCSLGIVPLADGRFLVAEGACRKETGCTGRLVEARIDPKTGGLVKLPLAK